MSAQETVAKVAAFKGGKMLMGRRRDDKKWCFPGGHLDAGERATDAARRELAEETGLEASALEHLASKDVKGGKVKVHAFRAEVSDEPDAGEDPDGEFLEFQWVDPAAVPADIRDNLHSKPDLLLDLVSGPSAWNQLLGELEPAEAEAA